MASLDFLTVTDHPVEQ